MFLAPQDEQGLGSEVAAPAEAGALLPAAGSLSLSAAASTPGPATAAGVGLGGFAPTATHAAQQPLNSSLSRSGARNNNNGRGVQLPAHSGPHFARGVLVRHRLPSSHASTGPLHTTDDADATAASVAGALDLSTGLGASSSGALLSGQGGGGGPSQPARLTRSRSETLIQVSASGAVPGGAPAKAPLTDANRAGSFTGISAPNRTVFDDFEEDDPLVFYVLHFQRVHAGASGKSATPLRGRPTAAVAAVTEAQASPVLVRKSSMRSPAAVAPAPAARPSSGSESDAALDVYEGATSGEGRGGAVGEMPKADCSPGDASGGGIIDCGSGAADDDDGEGFSELHGGIVAEAYSPSAAPAAVELHSEVTASRRPRRDRALRPDGKAAASAAKPTALNERRTGRRGAGVTFSDAPMIDVSGLPAATRLARSVVSASGGSNGGGGGNPGESPQYDDDAGDDDGSGGSDVAERDADDGGADAGREHKLARDDRFAARPAPLSASLSVPDHGAGSSDVALVVKDGPEPFNGRDAGHNDGAGRDDGAKSILSNVSTTRKKMTRLRRTLTEARLPTLRGLALLRAAGVLITVLSVALGSVVTQLLLSDFGFYRNQINYVSNGALRVESLFSVSIAAQRLALFARGWIDFAPGEEELTRAYILGNLSIFADLHRKWVPQAPANSAFTRNLPRLPSAQRGRRPAVQSVLPSRVTTLPL